MRRAAKVDRNQAEIVAALRAIGATASEKSTVSDGALNAVKAQIEEMVEAAPIPLACSIDNPDCEACQ